MLPETFVTIWLFVVGLCIGSFLNVVIARVPEGLSIVRPASRCPRCGHVLRWYENIPLLSWMFLRARCSGCSAPISWRYPAIELLTAVLFLLAFLRFGWSYELLPALVLISFLVPLTFIDLDHWLLPFSLTIPGLLAGIALSIPRGSEQVWDSVVGAVAGFGVFRLLEVVGQLLFRKEALGAGDKMLLALIGAFLTWKALFGVILLSMLQGAVVGIALLLVFGRARPGEATSSSGDATRLPAEGEERAPPAAPSTEASGDGGVLHWLLWLLGIAERPGTPAPADEEDDWVPGPTSIPLGPWLALAALEVMLLGPWLSAHLPGNLGTLLTGI